MSSDQEQEQLGSEGASCPEGCLSVGLSKSIQPCSMGVLWARERRKVEPANPFRNHLLMDPPLPSQPRVCPRGPL